MTLVLIIAIAVLLLAIGRKKSSDPAINHYIEWFYYYKLQGNSEEESDKLALQDYKKSMTPRALLGEEKYVALASFIAKDHRFPNYNAPKIKDKNAGLRNILIAASIIMITGFMFMSSQVSENTAHLMMLLLSLGLWIAGMLICIFMDFLRPVGRSFMIIGTLASLFCFDFFIDIFGANRMWAIHSYGFFCLAFFTLSALLLHSKPLAIASYCALSYVLFYIFADFATKLPACADFFGHLAITSAVDVALIAGLISYLKPNFVPKVFRQASYIFARTGLYVLCATSAVLLFSLNMGGNCTFVRTIIAVGAVLLALLQLRDEAGSVARRNLQIALMFLIPAISTDLTSLLSTSMRRSEYIRIASSISLMMSSAILFVASLFWKAKNDSDLKNQHYCSGVNLCGVLFAPILIFGLNGVAPQLITIAALSSVLICAASLCYKNKNSNWLYLAFGALILISFPILSLLELAKIDLPNDVFIALYFAAVALIAIIIYPFVTKLNNSKEAKVKLDRLTLINYTLCILLFVILANEGGLNASLITMIPAILLLLFCLISKNKGACREIAIYLAGIALCAFVHDISELSIYHSHREALKYHNHQMPYAVYDFMKFCWAHIIAVSFLLNSWLRKEDMENCNLSSAPRFVIGYLAYTIMLFFVASYARIDQSNPFYSIALLGEQAAILAFANIRRINWLSNCSLIAIVLACLIAAYEYVNFWMGMILIGFGLIVFVALRLSRDHDRQKKNAKPAAPNEDDIRKLLNINPIIADETPAEDTKVEDSKAKDDDVDKDKDDETKAKAKETKAKDKDDGELAH